LLRARESSLGIPQLSLEYLSNRRASEMLHAARAQGPIAAASAGLVQIHVVFVKESQYLGTRVTTQSDCNIGY
jgi:hypothetical protein